MTRDYGIQFRLTGRSPRLLLVRFISWLEEKLGHYSTTAFFINFGQDIYLCKDKNWNEHWLEVNDYQFLYDILEHETTHGVIADLISTKRTLLQKIVNENNEMQNAQMWYDFMFNLDSKMMVPRHFFEPLNTPRLPDSIGDD